MSHFLSFLFLLLVGNNIYAQSERPNIVFFDELVMSEKRATELIELTRQRFWGRVPGFDGKTPIQPSSDEERQSIPIPRWDLMYIALSASIAGDAKRCGVDAGDAHLFRLQNTFLQKYRDEKKVQFAFAYSIFAFRDVVGRLKDQVCSPDKVDALRKSIDFIAR